MTPAHPPSPSTILAGCLAGRWLMQRQGDYHFKWEAKNADGRRIYCLETDIRFDYEEKVASQK